LLVSGADFGAIKVWKKTEGEWKDSLKPILEMKHGPGTARLLVHGSDLFSGSGNYYFVFICYSLIVFNDNFFFIITI